MPRVALFVLVALLTVSCEGPIGPTGPQGPGGPQGPQGETGEPFDWGEVVESENLEAGVFGIGVLFDHPSGSRRAIVDRHRIQCRVLQCPLDQCPCRTGAGGGT